MLDVAQALDAHIAAGWVASPAAQRRPALVPAAPATVSAKVSEPFAIKLVSGFEDTLDAARLAEPASFKVIVQAENGTAAGVFPMYALQPGTTTVKLRLAHAKTLAVGEAEVKVVVT